MSNTTYAELDVTNDEMKEMLAEDASGSADNPAPEKKKNVGYRILAAILAIAPIVCLCLLPLNLIVSTTSGYAVYGEGTLLKAFIALFKKDLGGFYEGAIESTLFGLPMLSGAGVVGKIMSLILYALPAAMIVTLVLAIIAVFSGKAAPGLAKAIAFINFWVYLGYALSVLTVSMYYLQLKSAFDILAIAIAGVSFLVYLIAAFIKLKNRTWMPLLLFVLSVGFAVVYILGVSAEPLTELFKTEGTSFISGLTKGELYKYIIAALLIFSVLVAVVSTIRLATKKGYIFDLVRYIVNFIVAVGVIYLAFTEDALKPMRLYAGIAAAVALVQIILVIVVLTVRSKKKKAALAPEETEDEVTEAEITEETAVKEEAAATETAEETETGVYAEAVRYEGYPKAEENLQEAEPIDKDAADAPQKNPYVFHTPEEEAEAAKENAPAGAATADYDFYNSRSFDPFIASLNSTEREQFTEIFILKYKGETKNLPDYEVGGDNKEFFRKVFIYLGQYRDRIPDSLLAKMYQFAVRK